MLLSTLLRTPFLAMIAAVSLSAAELDSKVLTISDGQPIHFEDYLVEGKMVIFGFVSAFSAPCPCEPCSAVGDPFAALQENRDDLVVIKVNIDREGATGIDWNSPVVQQFSLRRLPHFKIFGPDGVLLLQDDQKSDKSPALTKVHAMVEALAAHHS
jgi:hypothetical protein